MNKVSLMIFLLWISTQSVAIAQKQTTVYFKQNSAELTVEAKKGLNTFYQTDAYCTVVLNGYTDFDGAETFNLELSKKRCESVKSYLEKLGIQSKVITSNALGESLPIASNATEEGKGKNRRVEVLVSCPQSPPIDVEKGNINDLYAQIQPEYQSFCINPVRDTILTCKGGTVINVNANAFSTTCARGCVNVEVMEVLTAADALALRLTTVSDGRILQSGGMFYMQASDCNGQMLQNKKAQIVVFIPGKGDEMRLFTGSRDQNQNMNWHADANNSLTTFSMDMFVDCCRSFTKLKKCKFFWCKLGRIDKSIGGLFSKRIREENKMFKADQKQLSARTWRLTCPGLSQYLKELGISSQEELLFALGLPPDFKITNQNRAIIESRANELYKKHIEERKKEVAEKVLSGRSNLDDLNYYVFNPQQQTWFNIDAFLKMQQELLASIQIDFTADSSTDCKLVFPERKILLSGNIDQNKYTFETIPKGEKAVLVAMQYKNGIPFIQFQDIIIEDNSVYTVQLQEQTLDVFKQELAKVTWY